MDFKYFLLISGLLVVLGVQKGSAIHCYDCNSKYNESCPDENALEEYLEDCDIVGQKTGLEYKYCRKIIQTVEGETRVIRQCATQARLDVTCILRTGTKDVKVTLCECEGDKCNTALANTYTINLIIFTALSLIVALIRH